MKISMINYTNKLEEYIKNNKTYVLAFIAIFGGMFCGPVTKLFNAFPVEAIVFLSLGYSLICYTDRNK